MDVQQVITLGIVVVAAGSLARRVWPGGAKNGGSCPGCGGCDRAGATNVRPAPEAKPLVTLEAPRPARFKPSSPPNR